MKIATKIIIISTIIFISCTNYDSNKLENKNQIDTIIREQLDENIIGSQFELDSLKNPFISQKELVELNYCKETNEITDIFNCIIEQFNKVETPIQVGPIPDPNYINQQTLNDSIFITRCLKDTTFFSEPVENRTYSYYKGKIIEKNSNYILCLIMFSFNVGFNYQLCSFSPTGQLISIREIGAQASDWYEIYGFINNKKTFEIYKNEFDYKDDKLIIKTKSHEKYVIQDNGEFLKK